MKAMVSPQETSGHLGKGLLAGWLSQDKPLEVVPLELQPPVNPVSESHSCHYYVIITFHINYSHMTHLTGILQSDKTQG